MFVRMHVGRFTMNFLIPVCIFKDALMHAHRQFSLTEVQRWHFAKVRNEK